MSKYRNGRRRVIAIAALSAQIALIAGTANAADANADANADGELQEIVVTAERRESTLSHTPVAVSVLSADTLQKLNVVSEADLPAAVPGLIVQAGQNANQINYAIRGQSLDAYSNTRPGVQSYFDEIQVPAIGSTSSFYDMKSIQVLKGPQGTLFGRNSTGGAVLFASQEPTDTLGGYVSAQGGNRNNERVEGALNLPVVSDKFALRVAAFQDSMSGYQHDPYFDVDWGAEHRYGYRISMHIDLDRLKNDTVVDYQHGTGTNVTGVLGSLPTTIAGALPTVALYSPATSDATLAALFQAQGLPAATASAVATGNFQRYLAAHPGANPLGILNTLAQQQAVGPYTSFSNAEQTYHDHNTLISNITTFDVTSNLQLKNILGYVNIGSVNGEDNDGTSYGIGDSGFPGAGLSIGTTSLSEEFQFVGTAADLKYIAGYYYDDEKYHSALNYQVLDILPTGPNSWGQRLTDASSRYNLTNAGYAQGRYDLSNLTGVSGLAATAGLRFTHEDVELTHDPGDQFLSYATTGLVGPTGAVLIPASEFSNSLARPFSNVSWSTGLQDQINNSVLVYIDSRRSYRNGGYNGLLPPRKGYADQPIQPGAEYKTETLTDVEAGLKFNGTLWNRPATLNLALYNDWIQNSQSTAYVAIGGSPQAFTVNVPRAMVSGAELDSSLRPASWLQVGAAVNYTDARFTDNLVDAGGSSQLYGPYPNTARWSGDVYSNFTIPITTGWDFVLHGDVYALSQTYYTSTGNYNVSARLPGYGLVNFAIGLRDNEHHLSLNLNIKNALDKIYYVGGQPLAQLLQLNTIQPGLPRTILGTVRYDF